MSGRSRGRSRRDVAFRARRSSVSSAEIALHTRSVASRAASLGWAGRSSSDTGSPKAMRQRRKAVSRSVPTTAAGTRGTPAARATRAGPEWGRARRFLRSPFERRVPSGKIPTA
jgi:hypothetical protein